MNSCKLLARYEAMDRKAQDELLRTMRREMRQVGNKYCVGAVGYRTRYYRYRSSAIKRYLTLKRRGEAPFITSISFNVTVRLQPRRHPSAGLGMRQLLSMRMMQPMKMLPPPLVARALIPFKVRESLGCLGTRV